MKYTCFDCVMKIELSGPQGNAFYIMSIVSQFSDKFNIEEDLTNKIITEMESSDYNNLLKVFVTHFGPLVELYENGKLYQV